MILAIIIVLGVLMLVAAFLALYLKDLLSAIIAAGAISLMASVIYIILAAPDVAMTEAAIGSGLTTIVFLYALHLVKKEQGEKK
ncbi:MAG: DUF4040 domain-containing protein [Candidatus Stygibacter australis]|nr:DUF4040 domain-containing protein [Candidatus Stygibacter australis]MDP8322389.1 DUF4040 domain-containing protein [Candidatus Stygibacter australis]